MARELDRSGCPKTPAQAAVQVNIVGRDGSVGPPLFISPQTSQSGSQLAKVPAGSHVHNRVPTSPVFSNRSITRLTVA